MPDGDALFLAYTHERLAALYEARGETPRAVHHYRALIELWKDADPALHPRVAAAMRALARVAAEADA
ncbi:MAG TPA: hypothetical protein VM778_07560 [Gemmatimonadota bacterium]|nr:hypothetical protein [Gemmatimonadota bacterium]